MTRLLIAGDVVIEEPEIVLFDKDGTLIDIHHYWTSMIKVRSAHIVKEWFFSHEKQSDIENSLIDAMGIDQRSDRMKKDGPVGVKPRPYIVNVASQVVRSKGGDVSDEEMEALFTYIDQETSKNLLPLLKLLPGVKQFLEAIKNCGVSAAVVSTDITSRTSLAIEKLGLADCFDLILGGDSVAQTKPFPDLAVSAINRFGCNASKAVVVGDHPVDIEMGVLAGVGLNIGVLTGLSDYGDFDSLNCEVVPDLTSIVVSC